MSKFGWEIKALEGRNCPGFGLARCNGDRNVDLMFFRILTALRLWLSGVSFKEIKQCRHISRETANYTKVL